MTHKEEKCMKGYDNTKLCEACHRELEQLRYFARKRLMLLQSGADVDPYTAASVEKDYRQINRPDACFGRPYDCAESVSRRKRGWVDIPVAGGTYWRPPPGEER